MLSLLKHVPSSLVGVNPSSIYIYIYILDYLTNYIYFSNLNGDGSLGEDMYISILISS